MSNYKNSYLYGNTNISLPIYPKLKNSEINLISKTIVKFLSNEK